MRTNIVIDDKLMADAMSFGGFKTKREAVEEGLRMIKRRWVYAGLRALRGKLTWIGDDQAAWDAYRVEQMAKIEAQAAGLPFEGEIDPVFLDIASSPTQQTMVQEPTPAYKVAPGKSA